MPGQANSIHSFPQHHPSQFRPNQMHQQLQNQQYPSQFIQRAPSMAKSVHSQVGSMQHYPQQVFFLNFICPLESY